MKKMRFVLLLAIVAPLLFASCKKAETTELPIPKNEMVKVNLKVGVKMADDATDYSDVTEGLGAKLVFTIPQSELHTGPDYLNEAIVVNLPATEVELPCPNDGKPHEWKVSLLPFDNTYTVGGKQKSYRYEGAPASVSLIVGQPLQTVVLKYDAAAPNVY
ncbi:MAG: hypothetical protein CSA07_05080 [Bacteroidia bacterium]|nr:MAG: hypothetical protein CSA07_05080 [Bacteroidia bacterium]